MFRFLRKTGWDMHWLIESTSDTNSGTTKPWLLWRNLLIRKLRDFVQIIWRQFLFLIIAIDTHGKPKIVNLLRIIAELLNICLHEAGAPFQLKISHSGPDWVPLRCATYRGCHQPRGALPSPLPPCAPVPPEATSSRPHLKRPHQSELPAGTVQRAAGLPQTLLSLRGSRMCYWRHRTCNMWEWIRVSFWHVLYATALRVPYSFSLEMKEERNFELVSHDVTMWHVWFATKLLS